MEKISYPITFFGSGPVAARALKLLIPDFNIEAVVTKPGIMVFDSSPSVMEIAKKSNLRIISAENKQELSDIFVGDSPRLKSRVGLVIDYGIIIEKKVMDYFELGIVNCHFSLLPQWRGADPITFAILSGQKRTGISLMLIDEKLDEGPIIAQSFYDLRADITSPALTDDLIRLNHELLLKKLPSYIQGKLRLKPQNLNKPVTYSRKLTKDDGLIDWKKPAQQLEREVRAYIEWPKSTTTLANKQVIITQSKLVKTKGKPGTVLVDNEHLIVCCGKNGLEIIKLKPAGKPEMSAKAFLAGYRDKL